MNFDHLYTPWRMNYIRGATKPSDGSCVFCALAAADADHPQVIARSQFVYVTVNLYPYNNGHVLILPYAHVSTPEALDPDALTDLALTTNRALAVLRDVYNPQAFNTGANIGAAAGAGIAAHYHFHIVPRWGGDVNFMAVVGETRVIPDTVENSARALKEAWKARYHDEHS